MDYDWFRSGDECTIVIGFAVEGLRVGSTRWRKYVLPLSTLLFILQSLLFLALILVLSFEFIVVILLVRTIFEFG